MFTTSHHLYLYLTFGLYAAAWGMAVIRPSRPALILLALGLFFHGAYLLGRGWLGGVFIPNPIVEGPFCLPLCLALLSFFSGLRKMSGAWKDILLLTLFFTLISLLYAKGMIPPTPKKLSLWAIFFFLSESSAHACFYVGALYASMSLLNNDGPQAFRSFIIWGIVIYTISQVTGAVWSYLGWGNTFNWSPRHLSSASIWVLYLAILHIRFIPEWGIRRDAVLSLLAAVYVFIVSYGHYFKEMNFPRIGG